MKTTHSEKALKTLEALATEGKDWLHPAVEWKFEKVPVLGRVTCPDCNGDRISYYTTEVAATPYDFQDGLKSTAPAAFVWPHRDITFTYSHGATTELKDGFYHSYSLKADARRQFAAEYGVVGQACRRCYGYAKRTWNRKPHGRAFVDSHGTVPAIVEQEMWVGYIQWPKGTEFGVSRFAGGGWNVKSRFQCELCAKGINQSNRVPLVTEKDGKPRAMWVGQDCAHKFTGVMALKPTQAMKTKTSEHILKDNIEAK